MKQEKKTSKLEHSQKVTNKDLSELSDEEILEGFKNGDGKIVKEYFYGYCRVAYCVYDQRYGLRSKPGMDFMSLAHEYYHEFRQMIQDICLRYYGRDSRNSIILQMLYIDGFKGKEVGAQLGMSASAVTQRTNKMMHEVIIPYFKRYFVASDYEGEVYSKGMMPDICCECTPCPAASSTASSAALFVSDDRILDNQMVNDLKKKNMEEMKKNRITPEWIDTLKDNEIFVFGSNLAGMHGGGAARVARLRFGAVLGNGVGIQGKSYAIPTMQGGVETIRPYVNDFIAFAQQHPDLHFLVTPIGCGIAGFEPEDIAPLFEAAKDVKNISLPESFWEVIE